MKLERLTYRPRTLLTVLTLVLATGSAQAADSKALIASAYKRTKSAQTPEEFAGILELCEQAQQEANLPEAMKAYSEQLMSWTHNRRGEYYARRAAEAAAAGDEAGAIEFDQQALSDFESAVELDSTRWKPWLNRGIARAVSGRQEQAVEDFTRAIQLKPDQVDGWYNRGEILAELGRYEEALADYEEVIRRSAADSDAHLGRASSLFRLGQIETALAAFDEALRVAESPVHVYVRRAEILQALGRWEEAAADCRRAIESDRQMAAAYHAAAWLMATCPDPRFRHEQLAVRAAERALELDATRPWQLLDTLAAAYANAGRFAEASDVIEQAVAAAPPAQRTALNKRLRGYQSQRPYRQAVTETALLPTVPQRR